jgi:uncharacterized alkaline shock family protein YloU
MKNKDLGTITVSKHALEQLAKRVTEECDGVYALTDRSKQAELSRLFNGGTKGVYIRKTDKGLEAEIHIICEYGAQVPALRRNISERIKEKLDETGVKINGVSVRVEGVRNLR